MTSPACFRSSAGERPRPVEARPAEAEAEVAAKLSAKGDFPGAIARYRRALELDPNLVEALNNLAWLLATCPDASLRNGAEAVQLAKRPAS